MSVTASVYQTVKDKNFNGGWNHVGNGNTVTRLYIEKEGVTLELNDTEINEVLSALSGVNPTIKVTRL